jgi:hypothetical protein
MKRLLGELSTIFCGLKSEEMSGYNCVIRCMGLDSMFYSNQSVIANEMTIFRPPSCSFS